MTSKTAGNGATPPFATRLKPPTTLLLAWICTGTVAKDNFILECSLQYKPPPALIGRSFHVPGSSTRTQRNSEHGRKGRFVERHEGSAIASSWQRGEGVFFFLRPAGGSSSPLPPKTQQCRRKKRKRSWSVMMRSTAAQLSFLLQSRFFLPCTTLLSLAKGGRCCNSHATVPAAPRKRKKIPGHT